MNKSPFAYDSLINACVKAADPARADGMRQYMRNQFPFLGISAPGRKDLLVDYLRSHELPGRDIWQGVIERLWEEEEREYQMIGMDLAYRCRKYYKKGDHEFFAWILTNKPWWDTVDFIASNIVGYYFMKVASEEMDDISREWNRSQNMWLVRTSLIFQLKYKDAVRFDLLSDYILNHMDSREFFIQKAMGWALRQYSKFEPDEVIRFAAEHHDLPNLTRKEAMKHLNRKKA